MDLRMRSALQLASVSILAAGLLAGCGGSSSAEPLKKPQFIQEANSICNDADAERADALKDAAGEQPGAAELTQEALPSIQKMTEELSDLGAPVGDENEVQAIVTAFRQGTKELEANPSDLSSGVTAFGEANELAEEYGLTDCTI